jgi:hypothetical protein
MKKDVTAGGETVLENPAPADEQSRNKSGDDSKAENPFRYPDRVEDTHLVIE